MRKLDGSKNVTVFGEQRVADFCKYDKQRKIIAEIRCLNDYILLRIQAS